MLLEFLRHATHLSGIALRHAVSLLQACRGLAATDPTSAPSRVTSGLNWFYVRGQLHEALAYLHQHLSPAGYQWVLQVVHYLYPLFVP